jgi:hypothetical protein
LHPLSWTAPQIVHEGQRIAAVTSDIHVSMSLLSASRAVHVYVSQASSYRWDQSPKFSMITLQAALAFC